MRRTILSLCLAAVATAAAPASAQNPWEPAQTAHQALARSFETALPHEDYDSTLTWSGFRVGGGRDVFWHLFTPERAAETSDDPAQQRSGWLSANGASGDVLLCGDRQRVLQMDIRLNDLWVGGEDVIDLLQRRGVTATLIETHPHRDLSDPAADDGRSSDHYRSLLDRTPALRRWRLEAPQRLPAALTARHGCTAPGARSATQCATLWSLHFAVGEAAETPISCLGLGRYGYF